MATLLPNGKQQFLSATGAPLAGGSVTFYAPGTTNPKDTWQDAAQTILNTNPVVLDAAGQAVIYGSGQYRQIVKDAAGNTLYDQLTADAHSFTDALNLAQAPDLPSAATTDLGSMAGNYVRVTGTTTITSLGSTAPAGASRTVVFAGALTLTHNATSLILPGGANITTAAGDTATFVSEGSGNWRCVSYTRAGGQSLAAGSVIDSAYAEYTANADLTTAIPIDDTIPQITEGTQVLSVTITPKSTTNKIRLHFQAEGSVSAVENLAAALFWNSNANAVRATVSSVTSAGLRVPLDLKFEHVPGSTSAQTYTIRVGSGTGTARLNGNTTGRTFGGTMAATLVAEEIKA